MTFVRSCASLLAAGFLLPVGLAQTHWTLSAPPAQPGPRHIHGMAADPLLGIVVFGGNASSSSVLGDTWTFDGSTWSQRSPVHTPSPRSGHGMVHDLVRNRVVLFGGWAPPIGYSNETWEWDGTDWSRMSPPVAPSARQQFPMVFDIARQRAVLFSGYPAVADTWEWDGSNWRQVQTANSPSARCCPAMAYDLPRQVATLFGGYAGSTMLSDTWEYNGANWSLRTPTTVPAPRCCNAMAYDLLRGRTVMYGGASGAMSGEYADTWDWDGNDWTNRVVLVPAGRRGFTMVYDLNNDRTVMFGGATYAATRVFYNEMWQYQTASVAAAQYFGVGCAGSAGTPALQASARPWLGDPLLLVVAGVPANAPVFLLLSMSNVRWGTFALPYALGGVGMPGCALLVGDGAIVTTAAVASVAQFPIQVPAHPALAGVRVYEQAFALDPVANAAGVTASNGMELHLGAR